jgi:hypothetical protein
VTRDEGIAAGLEAESGGAPALFGVQKREQGITLRDRNFE